MINICDQENKPLITLTSSSIQESNYFSGWREAFGTEEPIILRFDLSPWSKWRKREESLKELLAFYDLFHLVHEKSEAPDSWLEKFSDQKNPEELFEIVDFFGDDIFLTNFASITTKEEIFLRYPFLFLQLKICPSDLISQIYSFWSEKEFLVPILKRSGEESYGVSHPSSKRHPLCLYHQKKDSFRTEIFLSSSNLKPEEIPLSSDGFDQLIKKFIRERNFSSRVEERIYYFSNKIREKEFYFLNERGQVETCGYLIEGIDYFRLLFHYKGQDFFFSRKNDHIILKTGHLRLEKTVSYFRCQTKKKTFELTPDKRLKVTDANRYVFQSLPETDFTCYLFDLIFHKPFSLITDPINQQVELRMNVPLKLSHWITLSSLDHESPEEMVEKLFNFIFIKTISEVYDQEGQLLGPAKIEILKPGEAEVRISSVLEGESYVERLPIVSFDPLTYF